MVPILHPCVNSCPLPCHFAVSLKGEFYFPPPWIWAWSHNLLCPIWGRSASVPVWSLGLKKPCMFLLALLKLFFQIRKKQKHLKKTKTLIRKDTCTPMFTAALFTIAKIWEQPKCPSTNEWIKKMWCIYKMEYYSAVKRMKFCHLQQHGWTWRVLC